MSLAARITETRKKLGEAHATATALADWKDAEQHTNFKKATEAAVALHRELQGLEAQDQLASMQASLDGQASPEIEISTRHNYSPAEDLHDRAFRFMDRERNPRPRLSAKDHMKRYGITQEQHAEVFSAWFRARGAQTQEFHAASQRIREMLKSPGNIEQHLHSIVDDTLGGFTVSEDFRMQVVKALSGFSVVRQSGARVIQTAKPSVTFPSLGRAVSNPKQYSSDLNQGDGNWKPEGFTFGGTARTPQDKPTWGQERIPVHIWQPDPVELTMELVTDSDLDLEGLIAELFGETMALDTDIAFLKGNGVGKPEGILNGGSPGVAVADASTYATPTANDNGFSYPRLVTFTMSLAAQYRQRGVYYMSSDTYGRLLSIEASDGHPIFPVNQGVPTLWGRPIYFTEFLDNGSSTSNIPILFGDPRFYVIAERRQMTIMRLTERYAPNVALLPTARLGGQLVLKEAFVRGTTQA